MVSSYPFNYRINFFPNRRLINGGIMIIEFLIVTIGIDLIIAFTAMKIIEKR
ncbi:hypothetical protein [Fusobacterium varium]